MTLNKDLINSLNDGFIIYGLIWIGIGISLYISSILKHLK